MWMGGNVPLGYEVKDRKLIVNEIEAVDVQKIFHSYAELGSVALLKAELDRQGVVSKRREGAMGRLSGGKPFTRGALYLMLQNRIYRGEIGHQGAAYPGQHDAIVDLELWRIVQEKLIAIRHERALSAGADLRRRRRSDDAEPCHKKKPSDTATTSLRRFWLEIARNHKKGCASRRAISKRWCSTG
jgi:site-specific DNA recombinase